MPLMPLMPQTELAPLPARSVALSLLLGSHPDRMSPAMLTRAGEHFGIPWGHRSAGLKTTPCKQRSGDLNRQHDHRHRQRHRGHQQNQVRNVQ
jgi:hypothetical protein